MARARATLRNCETFTGLKPGGSWRKNQSRVLTDEKEIAYYRSKSEFVVSDLSEAPARRRAAPVTPGGSDGPPTYTEATLKRMNKPELVSLGAEQFKLALTEEDNKGDLVAALLEAQG